MRTRLAARGALAIVALTLAALLVTTAAPLAAATTWPGGSGGFGRFGASPIQKTVERKAHVASMRAVAALPRPGGSTSLAPQGLPTLKVPHGPRPTGASSAKASPATSGPAVATPDVTSLAALNGMGEVEAGDLTPADPWVGVNATDVIQVVNAAVRITNRAGGLLLEYPTPSFFQIPGGHLAADSRIIWDAGHGRWVGEVVWFLNDFSDNGLTIAVSDGADPTAGWSLIQIDYGAFLPDFPSLASSSDKVVIGDDIYDSSGTFVSADLAVMPWVSFLTGGVLTVNFCDDSGFMHPRAAQDLTPSNDVHVVMEATDGTGDQWYFRVAGTGLCNSSVIQVVDATDLTTGGLGVPGLFLPPAPRQTGTDTIDAATDGRATDAVWQSGKLYWVATQPISYDAGATFNDEAAIYEVATATSGGPTAAHEAYVQPGTTIDAFIPGIGLSRSGTPIIVYSQSSSSTPIALYANRLDPAFALGTPLLLDTSTAAISGERWGDYAGVATDPVGAGTVWANDMLASGDGSWRTDVTRLVVDGDNPTTPGTPIISEAIPSSINVSPQFRVGWAGATDAGSGSVIYRVEESIDSSAFGLVGFVAAPQVFVTMPFNHHFQFRVEALDPLGHAGAFATGPIETPSLAQAPTSRTGTWGTQTSSSFSGGSTYDASAAGATASYTTTNVRSLAIVGTKASVRGSFKVYVDNVYKGTISCYQSATVFRAVLYQVTWATPGTHTLKIVIVGTAGHPRVDVDAYIALK